MTVTCLISALMAGVVDGTDKVTMEKLRQSMLRQLAKGAWTHA